MPRKPKSDPTKGPTYKPGYVVYLRSGGPEMTVETVEPNGDLNCVWFTIDNNEKWEMPSRARFIAPSVQLAVDGDMVDSRRGHFVEDDSYLVPPTDEGPVSRALREQAEAAAKNDPPKPSRPRRRY